MYRFVMPRPDMTMVDIAIGAEDLAKAFEQFATNWYRQDMNRTIGVWHNGALTARIVPVHNVQTDELEPLLQELKP